MTALSRPTMIFLAIGFCAGLVSGLLGVGGGIVIVPLMVLVGGLTQHQAHATSLAAVIPIASVGSATYLSDGSAEVGIALFIAVGAVVGAPVGAGLMARLPEETLKIVFGLILVATGVFLVWR